MTYAVRGATVRLGGRAVLDDVSVDMAPGTVAAVVGGDGAGKSTLLRAVVGEVALESGGIDAPEPTRIGYLPATSGSWPALTVRENMDFVGGIYGLSGTALDVARDRLLERAGLAEAADRPASQLSGGMRRKLGFALAMVHDPPLLVLDEPSTGVDPVSRVDLWRLVSEAAAAGAAVLMSTTYLDEAERAGTLLVLDDGRTLARGSLEEVLASFHGAITTTTAPVRPEWAWRRGRVHHECWPEGTSPPAGSTEVVADIEDVVVALSMTSRARQGVAT